MPERELLRINELRIVQISLALILFCTNQNLVSFSKCVLVIFSKKAKSKSKKHNL